MLYIAPRHRLLRENSGPVRQDYLDDFVWREIIRLLEDPALPPLAILARKSDLVSDKVATAFRVIAKKG
jgi:hypothetical protein